MGEQQLAAVKEYIAKYNLEDELSAALPAEFAETVNFRVRDPSHSWVLCVKYRGRQCG